jgi:hypothetical protein
MDEDDIYPRIINQFEIDDGFGFTEKELEDQEPGKERKGVARRALESLRLNERHFVNNLRKEESEVMQVLLSFVLCHEAQIGYDNVSDTYISHSAAKEE